MASESRNPGHLRKGGEHEVQLFDLATGYAMP